MAPLLCSAQDIVTKSPKQGLHFEMLVSSSCDYFCRKKEGDLNSVLSQLYYHSWTQLPLVQKKRSLDNFNPSKSCGTQTSLPQPHLLTIANSSWRCWAASRHYRLTQGPAASCSALHLELWWTFLDSSSYSLNTEAPGASATITLGEDVFLHYPHTLLHLLHSASKNQHWRKTILLMSQLRHQKHRL